jgi:anti-anti-sigma factor
VTAETTCRFEELDRGVLAVTLRPELNEVPWTDIERIGSGIVDRVAGRERPRVLVDLTELNHMGSAMVALVVRIWKAANEKDGRMIVVNRHELVGEVLQISGLAAKWTIVPTRDEALASFGSGAYAGEEGARTSLLLTALSAALLVVAVLALADGALAGSVARSLGRNALLWTGLGCAVAALVLGVVAVMRAVGNMKMAAVSLATLSAVAVVAGLVLALRGPDRVARHAKAAAEKVDQVLPDEFFAHAPAKRSPSPLAVSRRASTSSIRI